MNLWRNTMSILSRARGAGSSVPGEGGALPEQTDRGARSIFRV